MEGAIWEDSTEEVTSNLRLKKGVGRGKRERHSRERGQCRQRQGGQEERVAWGVISTAVSVSGSKGVDMRGPADRATYPMGSNRRARAGQSISLLSVDTCVTVPVCLATPPPACA